MFRGGMNIILYLYDITSHTQNYQKLEKRVLLYRYIIGTKTSNACDHKNNSVVYVSNCMRTSSGYDKIQFKQQTFSLQMKNEWNKKEMTVYENYLFLQPSEVNIGI